jgi:hypothetical protein
MSHTLSPPPLATVCDEGNDGEYRSMLMPLYYTTSQLSIAFGLAEVRQTWTLQPHCSQFCPSHFSQGIRPIQDNQQAVRAGWRAGRDGQVVDIGDGFARLPVCNSITGIFHFYSA